MNETRTPLIQWQDLFIFIDNGRITIKEYEHIELLFNRQAKNFSGRLGCFIVLPRDAIAPPPEVQKYLANLLERLSSSLRCLVYVVEGTGFKGAIVRAALVTLKVFINKPYQVFVEKTTIDGLKNMLPFLTEGTTPTLDAQAISDMIEKVRKKLI